MKIRNLSVVALALGAAVAAHASPNLIVNGSFEDVTFGAGQDWNYFSSITGWTPSAAPIEVGKASVYGVTGQTGDNVLELDSTMNSRVNQTLNLNAGAYHLDFDYAKRAGTTDETNQFDVLWNGNVVASMSPTATSFSTTGYNLTAVNGVNTLSFRAMGTSDSFGGMVDNVKLQAVPEPASVAAMAVGALGLLKRRKKA